MFFPNAVFLTWMSNDTYSFRFTFTILNVHLTKCEATFIHYFGSPITQFSATYGFKYMHFRSVCQIWYHSSSSLLNQPNPAWQTSSILSSTYTYKFYKFTLSYWFSLLGLLKRPMWSSGVFRNMWRRGSRQKFRTQMGAYRHKPT